MESPKTDPHLYSKLIFLTRMSRQLSGEKNHFFFFLSQQMMLRQLDIYTQDNKVEPLPHIICKLTQYDHRTKQKN